MTLRRRGSHVVRGARRNPSCGKNWWLEATCRYVPKVVVKMISQMKNACNKPVGNLFEFATFAERVLVGLWGKPGREGPLCVQAMWHGHVKVRNAIFCSKWWGVILIGRCTVQRESSLMDGGREGPPRLARVSRACLGVGACVPAVRIVGEIPFPAIF